MSIEPMVSVIIPTYNRSALLPAALGSALAQTLAEVEVIVIDDGSTDDTREVIAPFLDRIRYLESDHGGPAHARNVGLRASAGRYIAFLDSDDRYLPDKLELQVAFMEAFPEVGMVSTEVSAFTDDGVLEEYHLQSYHGIYRRLGLSYDDIYSESGTFPWKESEEEVQFFLGDVFRHVLRGTLIMSNTILFRREVLEKVGLQNETYLYAQEYEFVVRICKHFRVAFLNRPTYLIRYHPGQHSGYQGIPQPGGESSRATFKKETLRSIQAERVCLHAVLDWGCDDPVYYERNRDWLDRRVAELYHYIGEMWLSIGEYKNARESFRKGHSHDPTWSRNRRSLGWSYCPNILRRVIHGAITRVRRGIPRA